MHVKMKASRISTPNYVVCFCQIVCRSQNPISDNVRAKVSNFCHVNFSQVQKQKQCSRSLKYSPLFLPSLPLSLSLPFMFLFPPFPPGGRSPRLHLYISCSPPPTQTRGPEISHREATTTSLDPQGLAVPAQMEEPGREVREAVVSGV